MDAISWSGPQEITPHIGCPSPSTIALTLYRDEVAPARDRPPEKNRLREARIASELDHLITAGSLDLLRDDGVATTALIDDSPPEVADLPPSVERFPAGRNEDRVLCIDAGAQGGISDQHAQHERVLQRLHRRDHNPPPGHDPGFIPPSLTVWVRTSQPGALPGRRPSLRNGDRVGSWSPRCTVDRGVRPGPAVAHLRLVASRA